MPGGELLLPHEITHAAVFRGDRTGCVIRKVDQKGDLRAGVGAQGHILGVGKHSLLQRPGLPPGHRPVAGIAVGAVFRRPDLRSVVMEHIADGIAGFRDQRAQRLRVGLGAGISLAQAVLHIFLGGCAEEASEVLLQRPGGINAEKEPVDARHDALPLHLQQGKSGAGAGGKALQSGGIGILKQHPGNRTDDQQHDQDIQEKDPPVNAVFEERKGILQLHAVTSIQYCQKTALRRHSIWDNYTSFSSGRPEPIP